MFSLSTVWKIARDLGPKWILKRLKFAVQARFGILERRLPVSHWDFGSRDWLSARTPLDPDRLKQSVIERSRFFFGFAPPPSLSDGENVCRLADRILAGEWPFFSRQWLRVGFPPDWHFNAFDGTRVNHRVHWSRIDLGDIHDVKFVWEPSRFSVAYLLARAYGIRRDERYAEAFWRLIEDWADKNPPNQGVNWVSGQEVALRVMAWCFGLHGFLSSPCSTPERIFRLVRMIEKHGERIAGFIEYALSQRNNHGISEATGLFTIGILFPQFRRAPEWLERGRELIIRQIQEQIYEDGSYIQHSFNYERLMLDDLVWAFRLAELNDIPFPENSYRSLATGGGIHAPVLRCPYRQNAQLWRKRRQSGAALELLRLRGFSAIDSGGLLLDLSIVLFWARPMERDGRAVLCGRRKSRYQQICGGARNEVRSPS